GTATSSPSGSWSGYARPNAPRSRRSASGRSRLLARGGLPAERLEQDDRHADGDRRVGDVEHRPAPGAVVEVEEIDHLPVAHAADEVADGAAEDGAQRPD